MAAYHSALNPVSNVQPTAPSLAHAAYPNSTVEYRQLADGAAGTFQTLDAMKAAVLGRIGPDYSGYQDSYNHQAAQSISQGYPSPVHALFYFVRDQIVYVDHPWNLQVVKDCRRALESRSGDCVTKSVCLATLLASLGYRSRFVAQAPDGQEFNHVYLEVFDNSDQEWIALDPTGDGQSGRPLFNVGDYQHLPDGGFETTYEIF